MLAVTLAITSARLRTIIFHSIPMTPLRRTTTAARRLPSSSSSASRHGGGVHHGVRSHNIFPIQGAMQVENRCVVQCLAVLVFRVRRGRYIGPLENAPNLQIFSSVQDKSTISLRSGSRVPTPRGTASLAIPSRIPLSIDFSSFSCEGVRQSPTLTHHHRSGPARFVSGGAVDDDGGR